MKEENIPKVNGWFVKTKGPIKENKYSRGHIFSGPRNYYKHITLPICPACNYKNSPIMQIDISDQRVNKLNLWNTNILCIQCHNGCGLKERHGWPNYWWDYSNPNSPIILNGKLIEKMEGRVLKNWEFEGVKVELIAVEKKRENEIASRIGGKPLWLQNPLNEKIHVNCLKCNNPMALLFQWSETSMDYIPKGINETVGAIMGNPGASYWFGCKKCKIMIQIVEMG